MSFLLTLEMDKLEKILDILPKYEEKIQAAKPILEMEGRRLEEVIRTLPQYQASYDKSFHEMKALENWLETVKEKVASRYWKKYVEGYPKALSTRDVQAYIAGEKEIVELNQIIIEVTLIKSHLLAIVDAIKQAGYMVGHVTKLRVAELESIIL